MTFTEVLKIIYDKFLICIFILLLGFIVSKAVKKFVATILKGVEINKLLKKVGAGFALDKAIAQISAYAVYIITILIILQVLGIRNIALIIILIVVSFILGISLLTAIIIFLPNFFIGIFLKKKLKIGDKIKINSVKGIIKKLRFSDIIVESDKDVFSLPYIYVRKHLRK